MVENFQCFCDQVCAAVPRATARERQEIRQELMDHLEDRALDMMERNWEPEEAARRTVEAMGDAEEIGKALNHQFKPLWLWVGRVCRFLVAVLIVLALPSFLTQTFRIGQNLYAHFSDLGMYRHSSYEDPIAKWELDLRVDIGDYQIRFYQAELLEEVGPGSAAAMVGAPYDLVLSAVCYSRDPRYSLPRALFEGLKEPWRRGGTMSQGDAAEYVDLRCPVWPGQERVTMELESDHGDLQMELPLEWGD